MDGERLGETVSGSESLMLRLPCNIDNITDVANRILEAYESEEHKENFDWVDQIKTVKNKAIIQKLNNALIQNLSGLDENGKAKVWAAVPDCLDYEEVYEFKIGEKKQARVYNDKEKQYIIGVINGMLDITALKKLKIIAVSSSDTTVLDQWSAYRCLYAEVNGGDSVYLLIDGKWYEIADDFCGEVKDGYDKTVIKKDEYIDYNHEGEAAYNKELAQSLSGDCYDCKTVTYGSSHSKIEVAISKLKKEI